MKFLIAFALIAVAAALPEPISLPKAALPAFEEPLANAQPIELPQAELPAYEDEAIPAFEAIDISPMFVPEEVMEAVRLAQLVEIEPSPVKFVDNAEEFAPVDAIAYAVDAIKAAKIPEVPVSDEFAVHVVEFAENVEPVEEAFAVHVVENAEDIPLDEQLAAGELEAIKITKEIPDAVRVVDGPLRHPGKVFDNPLMR